MLQEFLALTILGSDFYKTKKTRLIIVSVFCLLLLVLLPVVKSQAGASGVQADEIINLTNEARRQNDLPSLASNHLLAKAAQAKAKAILKSQYFSHDQPAMNKKFADWVKEEDYRYLVVGENLAMGFGSSSAVVEAWLKSPSHRDNILKKEYQDIGLAVAKGKINGQNAYVVVQYLGQTANRLLSENMNLFGKKTLPRLFIGQLKKIPVRLS